MRASCAPDFDCVAAPGVLPPMDTPGAPLTEITQALAGAVDAKEQLGGSKVSRSRCGRQLLMTGEMRGTGTV